MNIIKSIAIYTTLGIMAPIISLIVAIVYFSDIKFWRCKKTTYFGLVKEILISSHSNLTSK